MKARKSIFVPKKADLRNKRDIDFSGVDLHGNSDDEDEDSQASGKHSSNQGSRYNLLAYNKDRKRKLNEFDFTMDRGDDEEDDDFDKQVMMANKLNLNCFGNLEISLFWEEKLAILVRTAQLYSVLFFFYYEQWPSNTRKYLTVMFSAFNGSLYIMD